MTILMLVSNFLFNHFMYQMLGGVTQAPSMVIEPCTEIVNELEILHRRTRETADELRHLEQEQESFALQYHDCTKINGECCTLTKNYWNSLCHVIYC